METYNIGGQEYPVIKYVPVKDSAGNLISDEGIPLIELPWVSDYKWQFDCLVDRLEHPEKYAAFEDVEERILHLKTWLLDHAESKEQERAVLSLFK